MGMLMTGPGIAASAASLRPTPLLAYLANGYAPELAAIWPAPHDGFLTLPAARRHAAAMLIDASRPVSDADAAHIAGQVTFSRDCELGEVILEGGPGGGGLMKMLGRLGEILWQPEDYAALLRLKARNSATKLLQHMKTVNPASLRLAAGLPDMFLHPVIIAGIPTPACALDLVEAIGVIEAGDGRGAVHDLVRRMIRAKSDVARMDMVGDALLPNVFAPYRPLPQLPGRFQPVCDRAQLKVTALAFKNCLRSYDGDLASGQIGVFVTASDPSVVLSVGRDARGWMLEEAKIAANEPVPKPLLKDLAADLVSAGVRVGTGLGDLQRRLHGHVCKTCQTPSYDPYPNWRQELADAE